MPAPSAFVIKDRAMETSTSVGTGSFNLDGAVAGYQSLSAIGISNTFPYAIYAVDANGNPTGEWETGIGTYTGSLSRTTPVASSNAGALVDFAAGTKRVECALIASTAVLDTLTQTLTKKTLTSPKMDFGSDADGDIYVRTGGVLARLPAGGEGQVLTIVSGVPAWADLPAP